MRHSNESHIRVYRQNRYTPDTITRLGENEIFVFGTNPEGKHNSAAAKCAVQAFGAVYGKGEGVSGRSYAIPVHKHRIWLMQEAVKRFIAFARCNEDKIFYVLPIGCGKAGMETITVAAMFKDAFGLENVILPETFVAVLSTGVSLSDLTRFDLNKGKLLHREQFGKGLEWSLYGDGTLEISGYGNMPEYTNHWESYFGEGQPKWIGCERYGVMPYRLIISNGITYVGTNAFESFGCLREVYLAQSVAGLGKMAFYNCFNIERINIPSQIALNNFKKAELPLYYNDRYVQIEDWLIDKSLIDNG